MTYPVLHDPYPQADIARPCGTGVESVMHRLFARSRERGSLRLTVAKLGPYALVEWTTTNTGGQTLLQRREGRYCVVTSGGGVMGEETLREAGMPRGPAHELWHRLTQSRS